MVLSSTQPLTEMNIKNKNCVLPGSYAASSGNFFPTFDCPQTSVINYYYSQCSNPEERSYHLLGCGSLKSHRGQPGIFPGWRGGAVTAARTKG